MATKAELFTATIYQKRPEIIFEIASKDILFRIYAALPASLMDSVGLRIYAQGFIFCGFTVLAQHPVSDILPYIFSKF